MAAAAVAAAGPGSITGGLSSAVPPAGQAALVHPALRAGDVVPGVLPDGLRAGELTGHGFLDNRSW